MFSIKNLKTKFREYFDFSDIVLLLSFILVGGFNDYLACLISIALLVNLFIKVIKNKSFKININLLSIAVFTIVLFYGLTIFWAIDSGMAFIGFLKFLPVGLYLSLLQQRNNTKILEVIPYFVAVLVIISSLCSFVPYISSLFLTSGRFSGFFQYPNTFAILLLISELMVLKKDKLKWQDFATILILSAGLLYTGSRTVFLLFLVANFLMVSIKFKRKQRFIIFGAAALLIIAVLLIALYGPEGNILGRYLEIGLNQSTFIGRFLYMRDALPLLLKYPFGSGYMGYYYMQGAVQTGVYNVSFVHNDILQIALDVGIIPALFLVGAIVRFSFKKTNSLGDKLIIVIFTLHNMFDFNLQFIGMFMFYLLLLNNNDGKEINIKSYGFINIIVSLLALVNIYMFFPLMLSGFGLYETADGLYPYNTNTKGAILEQQQDIISANEIADEMLEYNTEYYAPYSIKAKYCYSQGDFIGVAQNKREVFAKRKYKYDEYREYFIMLANGIAAYENMGDYKSSAVLKNELYDLKDLLEENAESVSKLGSMIEEQPGTLIPDEALRYLNEQVGD